MMADSTTKVSTEETTDGIAIVFVTRGDADAVRDHARQMAEMHNQKHCCMKMAPSHATAEDADGGARIVIVPDDPAQAESVREHVRTHVAMMAKGQCPMNGT